MDVASLLTQGGGWAVGVAVCWLVGTGKLRLAREVVALERQMDDLRTSYTTAIGKLDDTQAKERASLQASVDAEKHRVSEIGARLDRLIDQQTGSRPGMGREQ